MKLTFKKQAQITGLARVAHPYGPSTDIRLGGRSVGRIDPPRYNSPEKVWKVWLALTDATILGGWRWVVLKARFASDEEAREFVTKHAETLLAKGLYRFEKDWDK